jgi:ubiquinone/menaquinone biosynthesis C-methylase UbiE
MFNDMETELSAFKKNLIEHYDVDAADYYKRNYLDETSYSPHWFRQHYIERMVESLGPHRASKILDAGCGPGGLVLSLLRKGYRVWGVDISSRMIDEATEFVRRNGFPDFNQLTVGDIEVLDFDQEFFDVIIASGVIEYQKTDTIALSEMNRVLANGGHLIVNVTNRYSCNHLLRPVYHPLKQIPLARRVFGTIKRDILRQGELGTIPPARTHRPSRFDRMLDAHGFKKVRHNYFHFTPVPAPLDALVWSVCLRVGKSMERLSGTAFGRLGGGYLVMAEKVRSL